MESREHSIIIVEDEGLIAADLQGRLERAGYHVPAVAGDAVQALEVIREKSPDLILMDIRLRGDTDGIQVAEHWTRTAKVINEMAVIRSMTSKEGNHGRATYLLHTSYPRSGGIVHPGFGTLVAKELGATDFDLPQFVSISGASIGPSYLGVRYAPFVITDPTSTSVDPRLEMR